MKKIKRAYFLFKIMPPFLQIPKIINSQDKLGNVIKLTRESSF